MYSRHHYYKSCEFMLTMLMPSTPVSLLQVHLWYKFDSLHKRSFGQAGTSGEGCQTCANGALAVCRLEQKSIC